MTDKINQKAFIVNNLSVGTKQYSYLKLTLYMKGQKQNSQVHQSEIDEGFVPIKNLIQLKLEIILKKQEKINETKKQFVSRYIMEGIMRKQPAQCYKRFRKFDFLQQDQKLNKESHQFEDDQNIIEKESSFNDLPQAVSQKQKRSQKQKLMTPYDKFMASANFILIYSRYKDFKFSNADPNFAANFVKLDCLRSKQDAKYKAIRPFQLLDEKKQQISVSNLQRSCSIKESILQFDSKFESGNLLCAFKHKNQAHTYTLFIQNDTNSYGYNHWFYFSVKNASPGIKYRFNIVNFRKRHSFFKDGNKPVVFSLIDSKKQDKSGYSKRGQNIYYGKSSIIKSYDTKQRLFQFSFSLNFWNENDVYYISTNLPYSYSKMLNNLSLYESISAKNKIYWSLESIGTSISGNSIPYVTITKFQDSYAGDYMKSSRSYRQSYQTISNEVKQQKPKKKLKHVHSQHQTPIKRVIFLVARQHPGQTWSSYLMDQFMHSLVTQTTPQSKYLLDNFIIKFIPMINVDGVICGNFRCDLAGMDLNRNWKNPSNLLHPQIFSIKNQIQNLTDKGYKIETYFDLHGHSKQYNLFCYSCKTDNYECRILPYLFSQHNQQFHFPFCTFGISRYKQTTARAAVFGIIKNTNVLTIQSSLFGSKINGKIKVFEPESMKNMAETMIKGCKSYFAQDQKYYKTKQIIKQRIQEFLSYKGQNGVDALSGSDSQPSGDQMNMIDKLQKILPKNIVNQYPQIQEMKQSVKKTKRKVKKQNTQLNQQKRLTKKDQTSTNNEIKSSNSIQDRIPSKTMKSNWQSFIAKKNQPRENNTTSNFQTRSFIMSNKSIVEDDFLSTSKQLYRDLLNRQDQKLAFFPRQKQGLIPMKLRNQSLEIFKDAYNATEKHIKTRYQQSADETKDQKRYTNRKIAFYKDVTKKDDKDEFPLLCVMSQNRKRKQIQIMLSRRQESINKSLVNGNQIQKQRTAVQTRSQAIKQLRQRNTKNVELVSKIWKDNINRFGMGYSAFRIQD